MTGYSGTPLHQKLGLKEDMRVGVIGAPAGFVETLVEIPPSVDFHEKFEPSELFLVFSRWADEMTSHFSSAMGVLPANGAIWVAWPKKSSGVETDMTEDTMRELFLPTGMVDNKVCAIDDVWSGLRFVVRKENRATWNATP